MAMDYKEAIEHLIKECQHRIDVITDFMEENKDADKDKCLENIEIYKTDISAMQELQEYKKLGTLDEVREAIEKQRTKKPRYKHYENIGEPPYIKTVCPNGCRIQLHPVTDKHFAHEHNYCPKCGQAIDWSENYG